MDKGATLSLVKEGKSEVREASQRSLESDEFGVGLSQSDKEGKGIPPAVGRTHLMPEKFGRLEEWEVVYKVRNTCFLIFLT